MSKTVVGIFDSAKEAANAVGRLTNSGFDRGLIDLTVNNENTFESTAGNVSKESLSERIGRFFKTLFDDEEETAKYSGVARKGGAVISVLAISANEAERAADILDECGAVDVDERAKDIGNTNGLMDEANSDDKKLEISENTESEIAPKRTPGNDSLSPEETSIRTPNEGTNRGRVRSRIFDHPVDESSRLREERVSVDGDTQNLSNPEKKSPW